MVIYHFISKRSHGIIVKCQYTLISRPQLPNPFSLAGRVILCVRTACFVTSWQWKTRGNGTIIPKKWRTDSAWRMLVESWILVWSSRRLPWNVWSKMTMIRANARLILRRTRSVRGPGMNGRMSAGDKDYLLIIRKYWSRLKNWEKQRIEWIINWTEETANEYQMEVRKTDGS